MPSPLSLRRNPDLVTITITLMRWEANTEQSQYVNTHSRFF